MLATAGLVSWRPMITSLQILLFITLLMNLSQQWEFLCKLLIEPAGSRSLDD